MSNSLTMQIAIPFAQIESLNPNIGETNFQKSLEIYLMNISTCFVSIRKHNPHIGLQLYTNKKPPDKFVKGLQDIGVTIKITPFTFIPPAENGNLFRGCFYIFDAIANMQESTLFLDPDIICIRKIDLPEIQRAVPKEEIGFFYPGFSNEKKINGLTHNEAIEKYNSLMGTSYSPSRHIGGECIFLPISLRDSLMLDFRNYWLLANQDTKFPKSSFLTTEEHILSVISLKFSSFSLNRHISRIWTTKTYRKVEGSHAIEGLTFWHLPSEKDRGLLDFFHFISMNKNEYLNFSEDEEIHFLKKTLSLDFSLARNLISLVLSRIKSTFGLARQE